MYELLVSVPVVAYLIWSVWADPQLFTDWHMYAWAVAVMVADLLPVPTNVSMGFSLSFPLELSAALLFPTPTAAAIAFLGATDARELKGEIPPLKALFVRSQIAVCVIAESAVFERKSEWPKPHLNLAEANRLQLLNAGLADHKVEISSLCTRCRKDLFHSYRRDGKKTGHMLSVIGITP